MSIFCFYFSFYVLISNVFINVQNILVFYKKSMVTSLY